MIDGPGVRARLEAAASDVDRIADSMDLAGMTRSRRRGATALRLVGLGALACASLVAVVIGIVVSGPRGSSPPTTTVVPGLSARPVDLAATPEGWTPLDFGDVQVSVPPNWRPKALVFHGPPHLTLSYVAEGSGGDGVTLQAATYPSGHPPYRLEHIHGLAVRIWERFRLAIVPAAGVQIEWSGDGRSVLDTLTWSPQAAALAARTTAPPASSWRRVSFGGVQVAVPESWRVKRILGSCAASFFVNEDAVLLDRDLPLKCLTAPGLPVVVEPRRMGVMVNLLRQDSALGPYKFPTRCVARRTSPAETLCTARAPLADLMLVEVTVHGHKPVLVAIGQFGDGHEVQQIYDSIRPAP